MIQVAVRPPSLRSGAELIVVVRREIGLLAPLGRLAGTPDVVSLSNVLASAGATLRPLFSGSARPSEAPAIRDSTGWQPNLSRYHRVEGAAGDLELIARQLRELKAVEAAYVKPPPEPARRLDVMPPRADEPPARTPDFTPRQGYLDAAPGGIDARFAWTQPGGDGVGVQIIDIEGAWRFTHEDLLMNQGGVMGGTQRPEALWRDHGTAVCGEIGGDRNGFGVTGICPQAGLRAISFDPDGSAPAIVRAANALRPGDVILIEMQRAGPRATGIDQQGLIAIEWWSEDFDAIRYATDRGVIVVEAAGNGAQDLDDPAYDTPERGFARDWVNPFRRGARDSGAILVGAGAPPENTHGRPWGPDRSRLDFSNFGSAIDAQGWGEEVTTCGYGDLQGGVYEEDRWYTDRFGGTSSASPLVVGAIACLQGVIRARGQEPLTPSAARELLRTTGSLQQDAPGLPASERIGNRPDLRQLIASVPSQ